MLLMNDTLHGFWLFRVVIQLSFIYIYIYIHIYIWPRLVFPLGMRWAFWEETSRLCLCVPEWRWRRGAELEIYGLEGDWLVPSLALMYGWQSLPSHPITSAHTHTFTCDCTVQHIHPDAAQGPRPSLTVPLSCCMLSCSRPTAVFSAFPFLFLLSIDNAINHHIHTALERMWPNVAECCYFLCDCERFFQSNRQEMRLNGCVDMLFEAAEWLLWTLLCSRVNSAHPPPTSTLCRCVFIIQHTELRGRQL